jgi:hypothetical protein
MRRCRANRGSAGELTATSHEHILAVGWRTPARFERADIGNNWVSYVRSPGALSFVPAGVQFVARARSDFVDSISAAEERLDVVPISRSLRKEDLREE